MASLTVRRFVARFVLVSTLALAAAACTSSSGQPLSGATVPPGSTLSMSRPVTVGISASSAALPAGTVGKVQVLRADGAQLFVGQLTSSQGLTSNLALATNQASLNVVLSVPGKADVTQTVAVAANAATASF